MPDFNFVPSGEHNRTKQELCLVSMPVSIKVAAGAHRPGLLVVVRNAGTQHFAPKRNSPDEVVVLLGKLSLQLSGEEQKRRYRWRADTAVKAAEEQRLVVRPMARFIQGLHKGAAT